MQDGYISKTGIVKLHFKLLKHSLTISLNDANNTTTTDEQAYFIPKCIYSKH